MRVMLERLFRLSEHRTSARVEVLGGVTTFVTMAYIIVVNPAILSALGLPTGPSTVATILAAVFGSLLMGLYANRPIAVAPYMGENAFLAFGLAGLGASWQQCLGAVFVSGVAFLLLTLLGLRRWLAESISPSMNTASPSASACSWPSSAWSRRVWWSAPACRTCRSRSARCGTRRCCWRCSASW